jgi:hypothetical protein
MVRMGESLLAAGDAMLPHHPVWLDHGWRLVFCVLSIQWRTRTKLYGHCGICGCCLASKPSSGLSQVAAALKAHAWARLAGLGAHGTALPKGTYLRFLLMIGLPFAIGAFSPAPIAVADTLLALADSDVRKFLLVDEAVAASRAIRALEV